MVVLKVILTVLLLLVCVAMIAIVLYQEGKSAGLGTSIGGSGAETFWSKNKGRSVEGKLEKYTKWCAVAFFVLAIALNLF